MPSSQDKQDQSMPDVTSQQLAQEQDLEREQDAEGSMSEFEEQRIKIVSDPIFLSLTLSFFTRLGVDSLIPF